MKKSEYLEKLQIENEKHINNISLLVKSLDLKIEQLKQSKIKTDKICERFDIRCYNYNMVYELEEYKNKLVKDLDNLVNQIKKIIERKTRDIDYDIQRISGINDLLDTYQVQLNAINKNDLSNVENLQLNAIKKEIHEKYMRIRCSIDRDILKSKFDKMQNRNSLLKALDSFLVITETVGKQRENIFVAIQGIDDCNSKFVEMSEPTREYKIIDIVADIDIYLRENKRIAKYKEEYDKLLDIKNKISCTFSIDTNDLRKAISEKYKSRMPMPLEKNVSKMKKKHQKAIEFLYRSGYIKTHEEVQYKPIMTVLIEKIKLLTESVERETNK